LHRLKRLEFLEVVWNNIILLATVLLLGRGVVTSWLVCMHLD